MNPKDSNVYRKATGWLIYDSYGVARGDEYPFSINIQSHSGLVSQHRLAGRHRLQAVNAPGANNC